MISFDEIPQQEQKKRPPHSLNAIAHITTSKNRPKLQVDLISYVILPRCRTRVIFDDSAQSDDFEVNDCVVCNAPLGIGKLTPDNFEKVDEKAKPCFLSLKVIIASNPKYPDSKPQAILVSQVVCEQCTLIAENNFRKKTGKQELTECAPPTQCLTLTMIEFQGLMLYQIPDDVLRDLLDQLGKQNSNRSQWKNIVEEWFSKNLETVDFYSLLWKIRLETNQSHLKACHNCLIAIAEPTKSDSSKSEGDIHMITIDQKKIHSSRSKQGRNNNDSDLKMKGDTKKQNLIGKCQCHAFYYCSVECQKNDWIQLEHHKWCFKQVWLPLLTKQ